MRVIVRFVPCRSCFFFKQKTAYEMRISHRSSAVCSSDLRLQEAGHHLHDRAIVRDEIAEIRAQLQAWLARPEIEIILTTGGTGFSPRDNTPEAVKPLLRREMDGLDRKSTRLNSSH